jgi:hypothetical protein
MSKIYSSNVKNKSYNKKSDITTTKSTTTAKTTTSTTAGITLSRVEQDETNLEEWPYDSPILQGWEPEKSTNLSLYLLPEKNTTIIMPR